METSVITNVNELDSFADQLSQLEQFTDLSTQSMCWVRSAAKLYGRDQLRIIIVRDGNQIAAAATLAKSRIRLVNRWVVAGSDHLFEPCGLVYRDEEALAVLIKKLAQVNVPLLLSRIATDQTWVAKIGENFNRHVFVAVRPAGSCPVIRLHTGWEDPLSQLKSRRRSDLRRAYRRAEQIGQVETIISTPSLEEVDSLVKRAMDVEAASWKGKAGSALLTARPLGDFFRSFAREASLDGSLRISLLRIDGNDAAMQIAVVFRSCWWIYKIGYDEQFARCSPGTILISETIRHAAESQLERYEFMGTTAEWLSMWTSEHRQTVTIRTYPLSARGVAAFVIDACSKFATQVRSSFRKPR
jgi:CelD/BcsL family acetyltransferase involved in cellulose biosynthesis